MNGRHNMRGRDRMRLGVEQDNSPRLTTGKAYRGIEIMAAPGLHERAGELLAGLPQGSRVLDLPAGRGAMTQRLSDMGLAVEGGDLFPEMFQPEGLVCHQVDMHKQLPFDPASFDAVVSLEGIEHIENPFAFVRECNRILKPGGTLLVSTPNILGATSRLRFFMTGFTAASRKPINEVSGAPVFDHISPKSYPQLRHILHTSGFRITRVSSSPRRWNRVWFYLFYPLAYLYTAATLRRESDPEQLRSNKETIRHLMSADLLMGRCVILVAEKVNEL